MRRILVVDDEEIIVNMVAGELAAEFDAEIYRVFSAEAAKEFLSHMEFDIVITDIEMPKISGLELLDFVKKNWPSCHVIVLTAYSEFSYAYHVIQYEKVDYVLKIDGLEQITSIVGKHLEQIEKEEDLSLYEVWRKERMLLEQDEQQDGQNHLVRWMDEYINDHYGEDISLSLLAEKMNYNPAYLSRLYSEQTGKTLTESINCKRVEEAKKLLKNSGLKIKDIAGKVGFYSGKHFNLVFKKMVGISPGEYREREKDPK